MKNIKVPKLDMIKLLETQVKYEMILRGGHGSAEYHLAAIAKLPVSEIREKSIDCHDIAIMRLAQYEEVE